MGRRKVNNSNPLIPISNDEPQKDLTRHQKLIRYLAEGLPVPEAGVLAGFSEGYSNAGLYQKVKSPRILNELKEYCLANNLLQAPTVLKVYRKALKVVEREVDAGQLKNLGKVRGISRDSLKMAGLLVEETKPTVSFVNIRSIQAIIQGKLGLPITPTPNGEEED